MISAVDLLPTLLDIASISPPAGMDGSSFLPTLSGQAQPEREMVYKVYNENSGGNRSPMRSVQSKRFGYLFNPWSDGKRIFRTATTGTLTYRVMQKLAPDHPQIAARLRHFQHSVLEEFYDYENDPDALHNLIDDPKYADEIAEHRAAMRKFMRQSNDPLLKAFDQRDDPVAVSAYVDRVQAESDARRKKKLDARKNQAKRQRNKKLFQLKLPAEAKPGQEFKVVIQHKLTKKLGKQKFHVTLKDADGKRVERIVAEAAGAGDLAVAVKLPADFASKGVMVSAFVGADYANNLLHRTAGPVVVVR